MSTVSTLDDTALFDRIRAGEHQLIDELYRRHRQPFVTYATGRLMAIEEDAVDCFQESVIVFYKNVVSGKLTELSCSISTYLFAIGKRMIYKKNADRRREEPTEVDDDRQYADEVDMTIFERIDDDHRRSQMQAAMSKLGDACRQILTLSYYHRYPTESIQTTLGFSSPGAVRIKKMRCLQQLKQLFTSE